MLPLQLFENFVTENRLFTKSQKTLLAVSGGKDSVLMAKLFNAGGFSFGIAHCNFNLRGDESQGDQKFVEDLAAELGAHFHVRSFDALQYAKDRRISIQMAARELRYQWFEEVRREFGYEYIALAHHQNDFVETILLNLTRGTGIAGLHGILPKRERLVRPLLFLTRAEIDELTVNENISYREDSSNLSSKYARNKIRLEVIPKLKAINPSLEDTFKENSRRFSDLEELLHLTVDSLKADLFEKAGADYFRIPLQKLKAIRPLKLLLYELFKSFSFSEAVLADLVESWNGQPGKRFESPTHTIILDRDVLLLGSLGEEEHAPVEINENDVIVRWKSNQYSVSRGVSVEGLELQKDPNKAYLNEDMLKYPLHFRSWKNGDYFYPLGLKGKKKLSDYFTNLKVPLPEKNNIPLLINANGDIIWIAGYRADDRYKVTSETKKVTIFEIIS